MEGLPEELLSHLFSLLSPGDLKAVRGLSRRACAAATGPARLWRHLRVSPKGLPPGAACPAFLCLFAESLVVPGGLEAGTVTAFLASGTWPRLIAVDCPNDLAGPILAARALPHAQLAHLGLSGSRLEDAELPRLLEASHLRVLDLSVCMALTPGALCRLASLEALEVLDLGGYSQVDDTVLATLSGARAVRSLNLSCALAVTDAGLASLAACAGLEELFLDSVLEVTDVGLAVLLRAHRARLRVLSLAECLLLTDEVLWELAPCSALERLSLAGIGSLTGGGLGKLASCRRLRVLNLLGAGAYAAEDLAWLADLPCLEQALTAPR